MSTLGLYFPPVWDISGNEWFGNHAVSVGISQMSHRTDDPYPSVASWDELSLPKKESSEFKELSISANRYAEELALRHGLKHFGFGGGYELIYNDEVVPFAAYGRGNSISILQFGPLTLTSRRLVSGTEYGSNVIPVPELSPQNLGKTFVI